jgi:hypothetical protein
VKVFVRFLYTDQLKAAEGLNHLSDLWHMSNLYMVTSLEIRLADMMIRSINSENVLTLLEFAYINQIDAVTDACVNYIISTEINCRSLKDSVVEGLFGFVTSDSWLG